jgi:hypothetical protein
MCSRNKRIKLIFNHLKSLLIYAFNHPAQRQSCFVHLMSSNPEWSVVLKTAAIAGLIFHFII